MKNISDYAFQEIPEEYYKTWKEHAIAKANREMLDESKKSVLAKAMSEVLIPEWLKDSESYRERVARQGNWYKEYLEWYQKSIQIELELKYKLDALNMLFEYYRSINALEKSKTKIL